MRCVLCDAPIQYPFLCWRCRFERLKKACNIKKWPSIGAGHHWAVLRVVRIRRQGVSLNSCCASAPIPLYARAPHILKYRRLSFCWQICGLQMQPLAFSCGGSAKSHRQSGLQVPEKLRVTTPLRDHMPLRNTQLFRPFFCSNFSPLRGDAQPIHREGQPKSGATPHVKR